MKILCVKSLLITTVSASALMVSTPDAMGQQADDVAVIEEIVVTARKRTETLQDVPFSVNALSQRDIERLNAQDLEDVSRNVAGLQIQNLGPGQSQVAIRGVSAGQIVRDQPGVKEQVGIYLDESVISLSLFSPEIDLYDLNRVEVLRGPQGTLYGSGSIGGTIRYITNQPNLSAVEASAEVDLNTIDGGSEGYSAKGMVNIPFANDVAAFRGVFYYTQFGGFIDALKEGGEIDRNVNEGERYGTRLAVTFAPTENFEITPRLIYQEVTTDGFNRQEVFNLFANPFTTTRPPVTFDERQQFLRLDEEFEDEALIIDVTANLSLEYFDITSVTSYTERDILVSRDASALTGSVSVDLGYPDEAVLIPSNLRDTTDVEQWTQELRLSSTYDGPVQWVIGGFYQDTDRFYSQRLPTPGYDAFTDAVLGDGTAEATRAGVGPVDSPFFSELPYQLEQFAFFGEASYDVTERLQLVAGLRYYDFEETRSVTQVGLFGNGVVDQIDETKSDGFTPRFIVSYDITEEITVNAQASRGFRLGGVNDPLNTALCDAQDLEIFGGFQDYDDETLWNYEAGVKIQKGSTTFNFAGFYSDIKNLQVTLDAGSCSSRISFNVPDAHSAGVEAELRTSPIEGLDLVLTGSYLESEFDSTVTDSTGSVLGGVRDGNRLASVPEFSFSAAATYSWEVAALDNSLAYVTASLQHRDSLFTQPGDQEEGAGIFQSGLPFGGATGAETTVLDLELESFTTLNLAAGLEYQRWELVAYVNNVTDENANLSFDRERGGRARLGFRTNQPRTYGLTARFRF